MIKIYYHVYGIDDVDEIIDEQLALLNKINDLIQIIEDLKNEKI
jgi:hypothetical protein